MYRFRPNGNTALPRCARDTVLSLHWQRRRLVRQFFAALAGSLGGAKIIVCINGFTDTNTSAGAFAGFALSNHIPVAVWELCNEPYNFQGTNNFFHQWHGLLPIKMLPYRNAIKTADSNAVVAVFFSDPGRPGLESGTMTLGALRCNQSILGRGRL